MEQKARVSFKSNENIFKKVLRRYGIPDYAFSIGSPAEQRVCLEKNGNSFYVYVMERGVKFSESNHATEYDAHLEMFHQLAESKREYQEMCRTYELLIRIEKRYNTPSTTFSVGLQKAYKKRLNTLAQAETKAVAVGDTVRIHVRTDGGHRERTQVFEGVVVARNRGNVGETITVRRVSYGVGCEKVFPLDSSQIFLIESINSKKFHSTKQLRFREPTGKATKDKKKV